MSPDISDQTRDMNLMDLTNIEQQKYISNHPLIKSVINLFKSDLYSYFRLVNPSLVLDAGCGEGIISQDIKKIFKSNIVGIDPSDDKLKYSSTVLPVVKSSIYHLPFRSNQFNLALCLEVLEHLDDPILGLKELSRVSDYAIISVPNDLIMRLGNISRGKYLRSFGNYPDHANHWNRTTFKEFVSEYFEIIDIKVSGYVWIIALVKSKK